MDAAVAPMAVSHPAPRLTTPTILEECAPPPWVDGCDRVRPSPLNRICPPLGDFANSVGTITWA